MDCTYFVNGTDFIIPFLFVDLYYWQDKQDNSFPVNMGWRLTDRDCHCYQETTLDGKGFKVCVEFGYL